MIKYERYIIKGLPFILNLIYLFVSEGTQEWYINGQLHRDNDQPALISAEGTQMWVIHDKPHRDIEIITSLLNVLFIHDAQHIGQTEEICQLAAPTKWIKYVLKQTEEICKLSVQ